MSENDEFEDDESITNEDGLLRRVIALPIEGACQIVWDDNLQTLRPSSAAFNNHRDGSPMSISFEKGMIQEGKNYIDVVSGQNPRFEYALVKFPAGSAREQGQIIAKQPLEGEIAHGVVVGKKTKGVKNALVASSEWVFGPPEEVEDMLKKKAGG